MASAPLDAAAVDRDVAAVLTAQAPGPTEATADGVTGAIVVGEPLDADAAGASAVVVRVMGARHLLGAHAAYACVRLVGGDGEEIGRKRCTPVASAGDAPASLVAWQHEPFVFSLPAAAAGRTGGKPPHVFIKIYETGNALLPAWVKKEVLGTARIPLPTAVWRGEEPPAAGTVLEGWAPLSAEGKHAQRLARRAQQAGRGANALGQVHVHVLREADGPPYPALYRELGLTQEERLLADWPCSLLGRRVRIRGRLFAFRDMAVFHAVLFERSYLKRMLYSNVTEIELRRDARDEGGTLRMVAGRHARDFSGFDGPEGDAAHALLARLWRMHTGRSVPADLPPGLLPGPAAAARADDDDSDDGSSSLSSPLTSRTSGDDGSTGGRFPRGADADVGAPPPPPPDDMEDITPAGGVLLPAAPDAAFAALFGDHTPFLPEFRAARGDTQLQVTLWGRERNIAHGTVRQVSFVSPVTSSFLPPGAARETRVVETQRVTAYRTAPGAPRSVILDTSSSSLDVMYGSYFTVDARLDLLPAGDDGDSTQARVFFKAAFSRDTIMRGAIRSEAREATAGAYEELLRRARAALGSAEEMRRLEPTVASQAWGAGTPERKPAPPPPRLRVHAATQAAPPSPRLRMHAAADGPPGSLVTGRSVSVWDPIVVLPFALLLAGLAAGAVFLKRATVPPEPPCPPCPPCPPP